MKTSRRIVRWYIHRFDCRWPVFEFRLSIIHLRKANGSYPNFLREISRVSDWIVSRPELSVISSSVALFVKGQVETTYIATQRAIALYYGQANLLLSKHPCLC